jgi:hypothetical protein
MALMTDVLAVLIIVGLFVAGLAYIRGCAKL